MTLQTEGMSEEEDGRDGDGPVKLVLDLDFRRQELRAIFRFVDSALDGMNEGQGGRKYKKRVEISQKSTQRPPEGVPSAFLNSKYRKEDVKAKNVDLEAMLWRWIWVLYLLSVLTHFVHRTVAYFELPYAWKSPANNEFAPERAAKHALGTSSVITTGYKCFFLMLLLYPFALLVSHFL